MNRSPIYGIVTAVVLICTILVVRHHDAILRDGSFTSGYILMGCVLFLTAFNWRKKLSFIPLGSAVFWMQLHTCVAVIAVAILALHVGMRWPNGLLESTLFHLFVATTASGVYGLYLSRTVPIRLSKLREEVLFERIPLFREQVCQQAHRVVVELVTNLPSETVADFYTSRLTEYFVRPRDLFYFVRPTSRLRQQLRSELASLKRYCSDPELEASDKLSRLIDQRDDLDYHQAQQGALKWWLFAHIGLTYSLVALSILHLILVHAFRGASL